MTILDWLALASLLAIVATWIAYPVVVAGLGLLRRPPAPEDRPDLPEVSVVIASRDSATAIRRRVENCFETTYPADRIQVVVARDAGAFREGDTLPADERLRVVVGDDPGGKASSLNAGVREATGQVLVFTDTHQTFEPATIPRLVAALAEPGVGGVSGSLALAPGSGALVAAYWRYERWLRNAESRLHSCIGATGAVWAMRRELWQPLPAGLILDDVHTPMRLVLGGHRVRFDRGARAMETRTPDPVQEYGRKVRTLTGVLQLCAWLPAILVPVRNPVWVQFVFHKLLRLLTPYAMALLGVWIAVRLWAVLGSAAVPAALALAAVAVWFSSTRQPRLVRIRHLLKEALLLQVAVIVAGWNGLRGRWEVWGGR